MARISISLSFICFLLIVVSPQIGYTQETCGTVEYEKMLQALNPQRESDEQFENWIEKKINAHKAFQNGAIKLQNFQPGNSKSVNNKIQTSTYTLPVVVHVIHNGEPVGTGTNISDAQIQSQIQVLNDDYNRTNADAINTPAEFAPVAGNPSVQFVLAAQDPECGLPSNGITRTLGTKTSWTLSDNAEFKALSYWPAENYLNIWVVNFSGNTLGFAQLPVSTLPGLESASTDRLTDGIAVDYQVFGIGASYDLLAAYNKGRTATHEIGHFLGLRHIWGDNGNCTTTTDYVNDTPSQNASTSGCPTNPQTSCSHNKMFQNYMDYTNDACMNLFTQGQDARMVVVLGNSPRRKSLLTSPGLSVPTPSPNDLGIRSIVAPTASSCYNTVTPLLQVRNYGNNLITSAQVQMTLNSTVVQTKTFSGLTLAVLDTITFTFSTLSFTPTSSQLVSFQILQTNSVPDIVSCNNSSFVQVQVPVTAALPIIEPFDALPPAWEVVNPDSDITWANGVAPDNNPSNRAMFMNFHAYENQGELDWLVTPAFNLATPLTAQVKFDLAYAQFPNESGDGLKIYALPGCNRDLSKAILLYDKSGTALATAPSTFNSFAPSSDAQWRKPEVASMSTLNMSNTWQLAFVAKNGYGNNLYVDNVIITDKAINDVSLAGIVSPGLVHCVSSPAIQFNVNNFSTSTLTSFQAELVLNGASPLTQTFPASLKVGEQKTFSFNTIPLGKGVNQITLTLSNPNGFPDANPSNNSLIFNTTLDQSSDASPLRATFDSNLEIPWIIASPYNAKPWALVNTNQNQSAQYKAFSNTNIGEESWIVSPVLDLSRYSLSSLFFDVSYGQNPPANDYLKVVASDDCGLTYKTVLYAQAGSTFSAGNSTTEWLPTSSADWKQQFVNLSAVAGKKNIRLAVVAINDHGNNIYVDNLAIFAGDTSDPPITSVPYQLYYSNRVSTSDIALTFNLPQKTDVRLQVYSLQGQIMIDNLLPETLNQTYYFDMSLQAAGIYLFRLQIDGQFSSTKVYIGH